MNARLKQMMISEYNEQVRQLENQDKRKATKQEKKNILEILKIQYKEQEHQL